MIESITDEQLDQLAEQMRIAIHGGLPTVAWNRMSERIKNDYRDGVLVVMEGLRDLVTESN